MTKYSKRLKNIFSLETEEQIKEIVSRAMKFKKESEAILYKYVPPPIHKETVDQLIEKVLKRFHQVAREIRRRHANRPSFEIKDEYDVQDLLRGLLKLHFDDVRDEEWTPSYAGASARMDLLLKSEQIVIEVKMARKGLGQKRIREQLIVDKAYYKGHKDCKKLYCFIYDPDGKIKNPRGFERDLSDKVDGFETKVLIVPR